MEKALRVISLLVVVPILILSNSCSHRGDGGKPAGETEDSSVLPEMEQPVQRLPQPGDSTYHFAGSQDILTYLDTCSDSNAYKGGILYTIAREVPEYADKLIAALSKYDGFVIVDKASMQVILYDRFGHVERSYGMACAKNYGTKHKRRDSRTPEGFFSVEGRYNSTEWLYTDDDGNTSQKKGQFGPRFIRLKIPGTSQIGIHGTCSPWSIGHRASHGCIRIENENILELVELVEPGMPVIVLPGKRDRAVNREEGYDIPFFPTDPKYAISESERQKAINAVSDEAATSTETATTEADKTVHEADSDNKCVAPSEQPVIEEETDSISEIYF